eukprot:4233629-Ditylum_brightwellii.AAC.1
MPSLGYHYSLQRLSHTKKAAWVLGCLATVFFGSSISPRLAYTSADRCYNLSADGTPPVVVDTGASCGLTPFDSDVVGPLQPSILFIHDIN